ncbi:hypothetical protein PYCC9005_004906 [Savitreella phatthalungensis]
MSGYGQRDERPTAAAIPLYARHAQTSLNYLCNTTIFYIYLLDLSFFRALLRLWLQSQLLWHGNVNGQTGGSASGSGSGSGAENGIQRGGVLMLVLSFVWCALVHLVYGSPNDPARLVHGYNHGGVLIDFVGSLPGSRMRLVLLDGALLLMHMLQLDLICARSRRLARASGQVNGRHDDQQIDDEEQGQFSAEVTGLVLHLTEGFVHYLKPRDEESPSSDE